MGDLRIGEDARDRGVREQVGDEPREGLGRVPAAFKGGADVVPGGRGAAVLGGGETNLADDFAPSPGGS